MTSEQTHADNVAVTNEMPQTFVFKAMSDQDATPALDGAMDLLPSELEVGEQGAHASEWTVEFALANGSETVLFDGLLGDLDALFQF